MERDAIFIPSGGTVEETDTAGERRFRSTSYAERDASGTLGGYARVQAAALLAAEYPDAILVPQGKREDDPSHAAVMARELRELGVAAQRIILEEHSTHTAAQAEYALACAQERGWTRIAFVSNEYHLPRLRAFVERLSYARSCAITYYAAESVIGATDPAFAQEFARVKETPAYQERLASEARGLEALLMSTYEPRGSEAKRERDV